MKDFGSVIRRSFRNQHVKHGGFASLITFAVIVGIVIVNLIVQQLPWRFDMSESRLFTLSDQTREILAQLDDDVTIYVLAARRDPQPMVIETIREYENASPRVRIQILDIDENPAFAQRYDTDGTGVRNGSVIVESGEVFRKIPQVDLFSISRRDPNNPQVMGLDIERRITNALIFVGTGYEPVIYELTGRGQRALAQFNLNEYFRSENYQVRSVDLIQTGEIPPDANVVVMTAPRTDISEGEADALRDYLRNGGRALFMVDFRTGGGQFPVLNSVLADFGVEFVSGIVLEDDQNRQAFRPFDIIPEMIQHDIVSPLITGQMNTIIPEAQAVRRTELARRTVTFEPLLRSSSSSRLRVDLAAETSARLSSDQSGPHTLAAAVWERDEQGRPTTKIVVVSSARFLDQVFPYGVIPGNVDFFMNSLAWLRDRGDTASIRPKSLITFPMQLTAMQTLVYSLIVVVIIPVLILAAGFVVWLRRRHL